MTEPAQPVSGSRKERRHQKEAAGQPSAEAIVTVEVVDAYPETLREVASKIRSKYPIPQGHQSSPRYILNTAMYEFANGLEEVAKEMEDSAIEYGICVVCTHPFWQHVEPMPPEPQPCATEGCSCPDYNGPFKHGYLSNGDVLEWHDNQ